MPKTRLTQLAAERIGAAPKGSRIEHFDTVLPGFALRVTDTGAKSWVLFYRLGGRQRRLTLGTFPVIPEVATARGLAREALAKVAAGIDPADEKAAAKAPPPPEKEPDTVARAVAEFIERHHKPKNRSWPEIERLFRNHVLPVWGEREIADIGRRDVIELLDGIVDAGKPVTANRTLSAVRKLFNWCVERDILQASPVARIKAPAAETERDRVLDDHELVALWGAFDAMGYPFGAFAKLLLVTAQRRDEVATMRWQDLDLDTKVWTLPRQSTKADRSHEVPLSPLALDILSGLPRFAKAEYVFTTTGDRAISGYSKAKARADTLAGFDDWRFHDLRRTAGTGMARAGIAVSTISRVLNHKEGGVTKIYNRYSYLDEKRHALDTWARRLESLIRPVAENVVPLRTAG